MNKKGFTLIELLAVILILGIIALIAIPVVSNILKETRLGAFNTTVQNFEKAAVMACQRNQINDKDTINLVIVEGKLNVDIDIKGDIPKEGYLNYNENCDVEYSLTDGTHKAEKEYSKDEIKLTECSSTNTCSFSTDMLATDPLRACYEFDAETGTIIKYKKELPACSLDVTVPDTIEGVKVKTLGFASFVIVGETFCYDSNENLVQKGPNYIPNEGEVCNIWVSFPIQHPITSITLPRYLTEIKPFALSNNSLTSITFPTNLKILGSGVMLQNNLTSLVLPMNLTTIGDKALGITNFSNTNLRTVYNKTNKSFNWGSIFVSDDQEQTFVTGTATTQTGLTVISD